MVDNSQQLGKQESREKKTGLTEQVDVNWLDDDEFLPQNTFFSSHFASDRDRRSERIGGKINPSEDTNTRKGRTGENETHRHSKTSARGWQIT